MTKIARWDEDWRFSTAVTRLALDPALQAGIENKSSCLPKVIDDAFAGQFGRLREREDMKQLAAVLPTLLERLRRKLDAVGLDHNAEMLPVVWIRFMREAGVKPVDAEVNEFEQWQEQMRAKSSIILYRRFDKASGRYVGPARDREGWGSVRGFTADEMLTEQRKKTPHWLYCYQWKCIVKALPDAAAQPVLPKEALTPEPDTAASERVTQVRATAKPRKRRRRSRQALERTCGTRVIAALQDCLAAEFKRKRDGVLEAGDKKERRVYSCQLSLDELVLLLKQRYGKQLICSDSTLKSALPHFVKCPRGRPGGMG
jgi:hypothetical protein